MFPLWGIQLVHSMAFRQLYAEAHLLRPRQRCFSSGRLIILSSKYLCTCEERMDYFAGSHQGSL